VGLLFRRRTPLLRVATGAATAGIAYRMGQRRSQQNMVNQQATDAYEATQAQPPAGEGDPPAAAGIDELARLASLHASGDLSDEDFTAAKAKFLGL
jgi:hypothetical protein